MVWGRNAQGDGVKRMKEVKELFADANEKECSVLGEGYLYKFLTDDVLYRGFCVMTDRRLYFKGKYFQKVGRKFRPDKGEYTIDLKDVTSSGFTTARFATFTAVLSNSSHSSFAPTTTNGTPFFRRIFLT